MNPMIAIVLVIVALIALSIGVAELSLWLNHREARRAVDSGAWRKAMIAVAGKLGADPWINNATPERLERYCIDQIDLTDDVGALRLYLQGNEADRDFRARLALALRDWQAVKALMDGSTFLAIAQERHRQQTEIGWSTEHDDHHVHGELASAAACYAATEHDRAQRGYKPSGAPEGWPWSAEAWRPRADDRVRELTKAAALLIAEIERLQRAAGKKS